MDEQLRIGLVGAGPWAHRVHAPGICEHPGTRLAAVWTRRRAAAAELAGQYGAEVFDDPDTMMSTVDAVAFAVPPAVQAELALRAATAGKHLILEKPVASTVDSAERLAAAVDAASVASLVMLTRRFAPQTRQWLAELERLGGWTGGSASLLSGALLGGDYADSAWRHSDGALADLGPHVIDLLDAALGKVTGVHAAHRTAEDLWHLVLEHAGGAASTVSMSLRLPVQSTVSELAVYGEHGYRALDSRDTSAADCYTLLLDDFVAMVDSGTTTHPCDVHRGLHLQRVLEAAQQRSGWSPASDR